MVTPGECALGTVLVTGGSDGLASRILQLFSQRGCAHMHSVDLHQPRHCLGIVTYHKADLTDMAAMHHIFENVRPDVVVHTASPKFNAPMDIMYKVNVEGTTTLLQIAKELGTRSSVYTRLASIISDGKTDMKGADETFLLITGDQQPEFYVHTKVSASVPACCLISTEYLMLTTVYEMNVLAQNRTPDAPHFMACAICPSGIFGIGDLVVLPGILEAYFQGKTWVQLGQNQNLFDFTENTNVAHAHYLAAITLTKNHNNKHQQRQIPDSEKVDGEAFFITNDEPRYFWDFTRLVWRYAGDTTRPEQVWTITRPWAFLLAWILEWVFWTLQLGNPSLTRIKVRPSSMTRYFCVDKAKKRLGYKPLVGLEGGLRLAVEDCARREMLQGRTKF